MHLLTIHLSVILMSHYDNLTFLIVLFIAPVTPELQWEPKLIHEISATAINLAANGGGFLALPVFDSGRDTTSENVAAGSVSTSATTLEAQSFVAMGQIRILARVLWDSMWTAKNITFK